MSKFHIEHAVANITDLEFVIYGFVKEGEVMPRMFMQLRYSQRANIEFPIHAIKKRKFISFLERRQQLQIIIKCHSREDLEYLYELKLRDEDALVLPHDD